MNTSLLSALTQDSVTLLQTLVRIPSHSREEEGTATALYQAMEAWGLVPQRTGNNVWATAPGFVDGRTTVLLNSHHDTVKPNAGYIRNPYEATVDEGKLYGLGSNDAGGALVALLAVFRYLVQHPLPVNVIYVASAEEEISGAGGIASVLPLLPPIDLALVGEPTQMRAAVAEKGLLVIDCEVQGKAGHAARAEGENALYKALTDIAWFRDFRFPKVSPTLGRVRMSVTIINAGKQHNVVPDLCQFTVDIRVTDVYTHEEVLAVIRSHVGATVNPRSMHLRSSATPDAHPVLAALEALGIESYGSPTLSDQARMPFPSLKIGPGDSARSHIADEFIYVDEIRSGIEGYLTLLHKTYA